MQWAICNGLRGKRRLREWHQLGLRLCVLVLLTGVDRFCSMAQLVTARTATTLLLPPTTTNGTATCTLQPPPLL
ncbi:hypothetical protein HDK77DRAFT_452966 [Phyllosticta capitalensis]